MVALLKHCCCDYFTYCFSCNEILTPYITPSDIGFKIENFKIISISDVLVRYRLSNSNSTKIVYYYKDGVVFDDYFNVFGTLYSTLRHHSTLSPDGISLADNSAVYSSFLRLFVRFPHLVENSLPADLELKAKVAEFVQSLDLRAFVDENGLFMGNDALSACFSAFHHKIHIKFECDVIHTNKYFPNSLSLFPSEILEIENIDFNVSIV